MRPRWDVACRKGKFEIIASTWNDESELPDGFYSVSDIQDYFKYIIKKHGTLTRIFPIHVYINRTNNRSIELLIH